MSLSPNIDEVIDISQPGFTSDGDPLNGVHFTISTDSEDVLCITGSFSLLEVRSREGDLEHAFLGGDKYICDSCRGNPHELGVLTIQ